MDVGELAGAVLPYVGAAATAYGTAVVQRVTDQVSDVTSDATVDAGRRILRRLFGSSHGEQIQDATASSAPIRTMRPGLTCSGRGFARRWPRILSSSPTSLN
ncbi:hypothetical protein GCM10009557_34780 [Virgisporangium ochraceum]|uniref:Uncharacterized protein n=1 Tax=Virgisporangium ochraceum TaxID=65505 RepID=A0A8J3ZPK6_9ACTN|nr:hypothetical protein [Virgisporangium ochraceum]GIJ68044.1 hypothetical protein Voc01_029610 [Virgisporangium ochraceum]